MKHNSLFKASIIKFVFAEIEALVLLSLLIYSLIAARNGFWGYWGSVIAVLAMFSPFYIYAIPNTIFATRNLIIVAQNRHTPDSIKKYRKSSKIYFIWGLITSGLYGIFVSIFLLENIFLFVAYSKELKRTLNTQNLKYNNWIYPPLPWGQHLH